MGITMDTAFENPEFLTSQIITYIGNKRTLIYDIESQIKEIKSVLRKEKLVCADLFSGSGIVSRMLKSHSSRLIVNDLENYSFIINSCYLTNKEDFNWEKPADFLKKFSGFGFFLHPGLKYILIYGKLPFFHVMPPEHCHLHCE